MIELSNEAIIDEFLSHIRYFNIVHHVKGRIRVKATWSSAKELQHVDRVQFEEIISRIPGINTYRVNLKALSVVIEYDPAVIPYALWEDVASLENYPLKREETRTELLELLG